MTLPPSPNPLPTTEGPQLRDALAWALAELRGETCYDNPQQVAKCFESAYAALSAPTTEGVTQGWQPIDENTPHDREILLGVSGSDDRAAISTVGIWLEAEPDGSDYMGHDGGFTDNHYGDFRPGRSFGAPSHQYEARQPSHWQPLPPPPGQ